ncbi:hypothetical protein ACN42_g1297 [Penicillium freii]|uniref:Uncharacterized protein n=1 Tax=Penicillium freii TaxID=48697 RepID=A0A101MSA8_PENFR|nr:hypothetical protein ACN42_g1297 [Penicillium freii]
MALCDADEVVFQEKSEGIWTGLGGATEVSTSSIAGSVWGRGFRCGQAVRCFIIILLQQSQKQPWNGNITTLIFYR